MQSSKRHAASVVLITLSEFAWIGAIGMLLVYLSRKSEFDSQRDRARILEEADKVHRDRILELERREQLLTERLRVFEQHLGKLSPKDLVRLLEALRNLIEGPSGKDAVQPVLELDRLRRQLKEAEARIEDLQRRVDEAQRLVDQERLARREAESALDTARRQLAEARRLSEELQRQLAKCESQLGRKDAVEFPVRRELTGLPEGDIRRVVFLLDTSSSMVNSPSWQRSRRIIRSWLEFFPVEECALVNFNDGAKAFPQKGYHRLRRPDGSEIRGQREAFLAAFDEARSGTHTDLSAGLRLAYTYPTPSLIVLFTDGVPRAPHATSARLMQTCLEEVSRHPGVPILPLALGDYEITPPGGLFARPHTNSAIAFLKEMARSTGGAFIAR